MNYNSKEQLIGEFIDLMDTFELDIACLKKNKILENKREILLVYRAEFNDFIDKVDDFMKEETKDV